MLRYLPVALLFSLSALHAKEPVMLMKGKLLIEDTFDAPDIRKSWKTSGDVSVADGTLRWAAQSGWIRQVSLLS